MYIPQPNLEKRYKKEIGQLAEFNGRNYKPQYVWWLEEKMLPLEKIIAGGACVSVEQ